MKVIAALSAVLLIPLAAIFGTNASSAQTELVPTALSILLFVAGTSLILGLVFGRSALRSATIFGGLSLFIMWLPLQYYATEESMICSGIALVLIVATQVLLFLAGGCNRKRETATAIPALVGPFRVDFGRS
ncbi:hypothetical protein [Massilia sp. H6]|uniref:hypothetical protein n=1 Tax=Massilia sp. H6 TaxID=2970464 RepID=UPI00216984EC|nr:hypothetical protein [Massilia sp. H6]UVW29554.1 hypothetical protein NRS07_05340 [Massilia sp. H6]